MDIGQFKSWTAGTPEEIAVHEKAAGGERPPLPRFELPKAEVLWESDSDLAWRQWDAAMKERDDEAQDDGGGRTGDQLERA
jgi:hypothetical protein